MTRWQRFWRCILHSPCGPGSSCKICYPDTETLKWYLPKRTNTINYNNTIITLDNDEVGFILQTADSKRLKERFPISHIVMVRLAEKIRANVSDPVDCDDPSPCQAHY